MTSQGIWGNGYRFVFSQTNPLFEVSMWVNGSQTQITHQNSSAINQGATWNTVRVTAFRDYMAFAINGTTVWSGYLGISHFTAGKVGFGFMGDMCGGNGTPTNFWIDYAKLDTLSGQ